MKKLSKMAAAVCAGALAASMCAVPMAMAAEVTQASSPSTANTTLYSYVDSSSIAAAPGVITADWTVTIDEAVALKAQAGTNAGSPGTYAGDCNVTVAGYLGTGQTMRISHGAVSLTDAKGISNEIAVTADDADKPAPTVNATTGAIEGKTTGKTNFSAVLTPGQWSGTCTYTVTVQSVGHSG